MTHFLQRGHACQLLFRQVSPDWLREGIEIEKIIRLLAIMLGCLCKQPSNLSIRMKNQIPLYTKPNRLKDLSTYEKISLLHKYEPFCLSYSST